MTTLLYNEVITVQWRHYSTMTSLQYDMITVKWRHCSTMTSLQYKKVIIIIINIIFVYINNTKSTYTPVKFSIILKDLLVLHTYLSKKQRLKKRLHQRRIFTYLIYERVARWDRLIWKSKGKKRDERLRSDL